MIRIDTETRRHGDTGIPTESPRQHVPASPLVDDPDTIHRDDSKRPYLHGVITPQEPQPKPATVAAAVDSPSRSEP
jgi:hypothetical protein